MESFVAKVQVFNRITIPKKIIEITGIKPGDLVKVNIEKVSK
ncbi:MAG: hypothetical protein QXI49_05385 [Candidatus Methanomethylicaceae archaeon]